jgi:hypothetical protein
LTGDRDRDRDRPVLLGGLAPGWLARPPLLLKSWLGVDILSQRAPGAAEV